MSERGEVQQAGDLSNFRSMDTYVEQSNNPQTEEIGGQSTAIGKEEC